MGTFGSRLLMTPPFEQSTQREPDEFGMSSAGWLNRLKTWNWNCPFTRSVSGTSFIRDASAINSRGPRKELRPTLPNVPNAGIRKAPELFAEPTALVIGVKRRTVCVAGLNPPAPTLKPVPLSGRQSLLRPGPLKFVSRSCCWPHSAKVGVKGEPLSYVVTPLTV